VLFVARFPYCTTSSPILTTFAGEPPGTTTGEFPVTTSGWIQRKKDEGVNVNFSKPSLRIKKKSNTVTFFLFMLNNWIYS
jgi:hypothetical protein